MNGSIRKILSKSKRKPSGFLQRKNSINRKGSIDRKQDSIKENKASEFFKKGNFKQAEILYKELIAEGTTNYIVYANLAQICSFQGKNKEIIDLLNKALQLNPKYLSGYFNLANIYKIQGDIKSAITYYQKTIELNQNFYDANFNLALSYQEEGNLEEAINSYQNAIRIKPNIKDAYINLGIILKAKGDINSAIDNYQKAIKIKPEYPNSYINLGIALTEKGNIDQAISCYQKAIKINPAYLDAHINLGNAFIEKGEIDFAINSYQNAIRIKPDFPELLYNLANAFQSKGDTKASITYYQNAIRIKPDYASAYHNLGNAFMDIDDSISAIKAYQNNIRIEPNSADGYYNLGNALRAHSDPKSAIILYQKAIDIKPDYVPAHNNLGSSFRDIGNYTEAIKSYQTAIELDPESPNGYNNLGVTLEKKGDLALAIDAHKKAIDLDKEYISSIGNLVRLQRYVCDWSDFKKDETFYKKDSISSKAIHPRDIMYLIDDPEIDLHIAKKFYEKNYLKEEREIEKIKKDRIRIGYFSADFREHPVAMLFTRILEVHDRSEFEIYAYGFSPLKSDKYTERIKLAVDKYRDVSEFSDEEIFDIARKDNIDIAIDLMGYTIYNKTSIFSMRVAPIQINYLGFSGSMGANCMDYIIADKILIPNKDQCYYTEKVLYLNQSAMCCDDTLTVFEANKTRTDYELPEDGFIFTCFNNNYKISPSEFDVWMNLLDKVEGSYLWLKISNQIAKNNILKEAKERGLTSDRLIFAGFLPFEEHLKRYSQGDLFLDTYNYNAGSTAVITLMAGMPLLTLSGNSYHSRMSASLLYFLGLEELISSTPKEYEEKAIYYATHPDEFLLIKQKLKKAINTSNTFNSISFSKELQNIYKNIYINKFK